MRATLDLFERTFICVDALDECSDKILPELLSSLGAISQELPGVRLLITGRPYIQSVVEKCFPNHVQVIPISPNSGDIREYLTKALQEDLNSGAMDCALEAEITERIKGISGVYATTISISKAQQSLRMVLRFLLVSLSTAATLAETTIHGRREKLQQVVATVWTTVIVRHWIEYGIKVRVDRNSPWIL